MELREIADRRWIGQRLDAMCRHHVETKLKYNRRAKSAEK